MTKVIGIHRLELKPGVTEEQVRPVLEQLTHEATLPGIKLMCGKGDRGERAGQYVLLIEIESVETRDRYFPVPGGQPSAEYQELAARDSHLAEQFDQVFTNFPDPGYTDYVITNE